MKNDVLSIAFIGGAINSAVGATHKIAAQMDGRWRLVAGCFSSSGESNRQTAEAWGIDRARVYDDWKEMLISEKGKVDAVAILTPTPMHREMVIAAVDMGYAVICEKAMAVSAAESAEICKASESNSAYMAVTYNYSGYPMLRELKAIIEEGDLGAINQVHIEMPQEGYSRIGKDGAKPVPQDWRLSDIVMPTISLDLGVHLHHTIDFICGEKPIEVVGANNSFGHFRDIVDNTICLARYTGNIDCQIWYGKSALGNSNGLRVRVYGERAAAEWYQMQPEFINLADNKGNKSILERSSVSVRLADQPRYNRFKAGHPAGFLEAFANYYMDMADALIEFNEKGSYANKWVIGPQKAHEGLMMLEAINRSVELRSWQSVDV